MNVLSGASATRSPLERPGRSDPAAPYLDYLCSLGFSSHEARSALESYLYAERIGVTTHGLNRIFSGFLAKLVDEGKIEPRVEPRLLRRYDGFEVWDGCHGLGYHGLDTVLDSVLDRRAGSGSFALHVANLYPTGCLSQQVVRLCDLGFIVYMTSRSPTRVTAPIDDQARPTAVRPIVGTNALCWGFPGLDGHHVVFDAAMSATTNGMTLLPRHAFERIFRPDDFVTPQGERPQSPDDVMPGGKRAYIVPFGGDRAYKGFGHLLGAELLHGFASEADAPGSTTIFAVRPPSYEGYLEHVERFKQAFYDSVSYANGDRPRLPHDRAREVAAEMTDDAIFARFADRLGEIAPKPEPLRRIEVPSPDPLTSPGGRLLSRLSPGGDLLALIERTGRAVFVGATTRRRARALAERGTAGWFVGLPDAAHRAGEGSVLDVEPPDVDHVVSTVSDPSVQRLALEWEPTWLAGDESPAGETAEAALVLLACAIDGVAPADGPLAVAARRWPGSLLGLRVRPEPEELAEVARLRAAGRAVDVILLDAPSAVDWSALAARVRERCGEDLLVGALLPTDPTARAAATAALGDALQLLVVPEWLAWGTTARPDLSAAVAELAEAAAPPARARTRTGAMREERLRAVLRTAEHLVDLPIDHAQLVQMVLEEHVTGSRFFDEWFQQDYDLPHLTQHAALQNACQQTMRFTAEHRVLDVGGGTGELVRRVDAAAGIDVVDVSAAMLERAADAGAERSYPVNCFHGDYLELELPGHYDRIVAVLSLHHFQDAPLDQVLAKLRGELAPGGRLFLGEAFLNAQSLDDGPSVRNVCDVYLRKVVNAERQGCHVHAVKDLQILRRILDRDGEYLRTRKDWTARLTRQGFEILEWSVTDRCLGYGYIVATPAAAGGQHR